jgi:hypothetical protein
MTKQLIAAAFAGCLACAAWSNTASADPPIYIEVDVAPPSIESYPQTVYEGRPVYYYEGRWYERRGPRWVYYREEPRPLVVYRSSPEYRHRHAPPPSRRHYEARPARDRRYDDRRYDDRRYDDRRRDDRRHEDRPHHHRHD